MTAEVPSPSLKMHNYLFGLGLLVVFNFGEKQKGEHLVDFISQFIPAPFICISLFCSIRYHF